jgi:PASTA domain
LIYLKKGKIVGYNYDNLFITARAVCSCPTDINVKIPVEKDLSVVYEKQLRVGASGFSREREAMPIQEANRLSAEIRCEMLESLSSADRYPRGIVGLLDTQLFAEAMGSAISDGDDIVNGALADWADLDENVVRRVTAHSPAITRSLLLKMPLAQQVEAFGLSFTEAVELRRGLTDIGEAKGPPPVLHGSQTVPQFIGMHLQEALAVVASTGLLLNEATEVDSPWPCGVVVAQRPDAGATVSSAMGISLDLASGVSVRLPDVVGLGLAEAACRVRDAGLRSEPTIQGQSSKDARVAALDPPAGVWVTPNAHVAIRLEQRVDGQRAGKT